MVCEMDSTPESLLPFLLDVVVDVYEGERSLDSLPNGSGRATFKNGSTYEGEWRDGYMHGQGTYVWGDGVQFKGNFVKNGLEGSGTYVWPNGDVYYGEIKNGNRHGQGKMFLKDEDACYEGQWHEGKKHGFGTLTYGKQGKRYSGQWKDDLKDGSGKMVYATGSVYEGTWCKGKKEGSGRMEYKENNSFYEGGWKNDLPDGQGQHVWMDNEGKNPYLQTFNRYNGQYKQGLRHGKGTFFYATGSSYEGDWNNNLKEGEGTFVYEDGTIYKGSFKQDRLPKRQGKGGGPGFSVKVDISDLIGENAESKSNTALSNSILRFNSELRSLYGEYTQVAVEGLESPSYVCSSSLLTAQIVQMCKDHKIVSLDYPLSKVRDVIDGVCAKLLQSTDRHYYEGSASVLYKDLVEILVRVGFSKYHWIESPAQRFATLVDKDILPLRGQSQQWHYLSNGSSEGINVRETLNNHKGSLKSIFDALVPGGTGGQEPCFEVTARDVLKLLRAKNFLAEEPEPPVPEEETSEKPNEEGELEGDEDNKGDDGESSKGDDATTEKDGAEDSKPTEEGATEATGVPESGEGGEEKAEAEGEGEGETKEEAPEQEQEEEQVEGEEEKNKLTLKLALKCLYVANFGSSLSRGELSSPEEEIEEGAYSAAISMKFPEFVDALALCADMAFDKSDFNESFGHLIEALVS